MPAGLAAILGGALLLTLIAIPLGLAKMYGILLFGDYWAVHYFAQKAGAIPTLLLQALPFLLAFGYVYWHYRVENVGKRGLAVAGAIVLGLYAICNYNTPVFQEATFRMTSLGRAFPYAPRLSVVACHDAWERDDVGLGTRTGAQMNGCHATKALPETAFDEWCMRIFKEKRPFKDHSELDTCRDRSKRLVGVANWPATRETLSGATIPKS